MTISIHLKDGQVFDVEVDGTEELEYGAFWFVLRDGDDRTIFSTPAINVNAVVRDELR